MSESYIRGSWPRKCGHCSKFLEKSAYYTHRRSYFDRYGYWVDENGKRAVQSGKADIFEQRPDDVVIHYNDNGEPLSETKSLQKEFEESDLSDLCTSESDQDDGSMGGTVNNKCVSSDDDSCKVFNEESEYEDANEVEDNTEVWKDDDISEVAELNESVDETNTEEHDDIHIQHSSLMTAMFLFILLWQKIYNVSDRGIQRLVTFLKLLLATIAMVFKVDSLVNFSKNLPSTLYTIRKFLRLNRDDFTQYVVCVTCHSIYHFENCYKTLSTGKKVSLKCSHIEFPQHPHRSKRRPCGEALLKKVKGQNGQEYLYPKKVYCYRKLITSLKTFVTRPGFVDACNKWKTRNSQDNYMGDIYDGQVWKDFESQGYFKSKFNLCLTLNVDWFQPYEHTPHSVGALYLVINNLPRQERFMPENLILVGLLPGPNEPKKNINSYLEPLVNELQELAVGVKMKDNSKLGNIYRALLMCIASDIPATRKCGGFVGHGAFRGCSKCLQTFSREAFGEKADYSDFHVEDYPIRSDMDHKSYAYQCLNAKTPAEQAVTEREYGARWTQLNFLNYFQPVRFHVVDPPVRSYQVVTR
ncbi:uncharacterized protein [Ptychodera flava]|uniref:uncharacterized protein isoform X1 n=2 Tax=Ptychodera flava TaxID=63121 RepID=UPI00396A9F04